MSNINHRAALDRVRILESCGQSALCSLRRSKSLSIGRGESGDDVFAAAFEVQSEQIAAAFVSSSAHKEAVWSPFVLPIFTVSLPPAPCVNLPEFVQPPPTTDIDPEPAVQLSLFAPVLRRTVSSPEPPMMLAFVPLSTVTLAPPVPATAERVGLARKANNIFAVFKIRGRRAIVYAERVGAGRPKDRCLSHDADRIALSIPSPALP